MEEMDNKVQLNSAEIGNLWSQFVNDSMSLCVLKYYLKTVEDQDVKSILEYAKSLSETHLKKIKEFFGKENYPIPKGFSSEDVNLDAPKLFSDTFIIVYMQIMTIHGLTGYAGAVSTSTREDQINYFIKCNTEAMELYKRTLKVMDDKGILSRPANLNVPDSIDFVKRQSFLTGWFGDRRPLNAIEFNGIFFNMKKNVVKIVLEIGFSQITQSQELREYFQRGEKICDKHFEVFNALLAESNLPAPPKYDAEVSSSTQSPFSDKLLLFHIVTLISTASGYYGAAFSLSQRRDLATKYVTLIAEITKYAEDGINIMIDKGWMEQPPTFDDRKELASRK
jgi:Protein of unknown function (DUF3231)